ncbi:hypothetical protein RQP46_004675 [Phenoliferia psychrophenolica]
MSSVREMVASCSTAAVQSQPERRRTARASPSRQPQPQPSPLARAQAFALLSLAALASLSTPVAAQTTARFEPPGNQVLFGAWIDTQEGYLDTPSLFNQRIGYNVPVYQIAQEIPLPKYNYTSGAGGAAPENLIELSQTDAAVFLTVYPTDGFDAVSDADFTALAQQISDYHTINNRTVFLRYAPEMQGLWNLLYGMRPTEFVASWTKMHAAVTALAPDTIFVWAPNTPQSYPYGQTFTSIPGGSTAADQTALDTNGDGAFNSEDDAFSPYYPGDDLVDWIGLSLYYKGTDSDVTNAVQETNFCAQAISGTNPNGGANITNWYGSYCNKAGKACMFSESGAAFHVNDAGVTQAQVQLPWITSCITNEALYDQFPRLKMVMQFEFEKNETSNDRNAAGNYVDLRDYRITNDTAVRNEFLSALNPMATRFSWAMSRALPTSISSAGAPPPQTNSAGSTVVDAITQTLRARPTTFPSLFGTTSDGGQRQEVIQLAALVVSGIVGALTVMKML